jgi:serine/threonine-protein kinase RsbW
MYKRKRKSIEFPSAIENICLVESFIDEICDEYHISNTFFGNILVSVSEAVKNAIVFGNYSDPNKKVTIRFLATPAYLSFTVSDEGNGLGFSDPEFDAVAAKNGFDKNKGLFIIQKLSDIVKFYNNGSKIEMIFHITSINRELSVGRNDLMHNYFAMKSEIKPEFN